MSSSFPSVSRESLFLLAPLESLRSEHVQGITSIEELKNSQTKEHLSRYCIGEYKPAIITDNLFSFFRYTDKQAYLIIIDKRSNSNSELQRYNFYRLLNTYGKGKIVASSLTLSSEQIRKSINLTNVLLKQGEAFVLELFQFHEEYDDSQDWWMRGVIYEIILASYQDSNNDGIGDIHGLRQRLDYIQSLGVKTVWLTPIYPSPWQDYGYDISNFCDINSRFGTLDDFRALIEDVHSRQMRIILDFVPNHTSNEHPWFQAALRNDPKYVDYYVWHEGKNDGKELPNNWLGASGQRMWTFSPERKMYYLHQFLDTQPDLDFRNEKVYDEMENVLRFWLDMGVDGFRADAVRHLIEDDRFRDEPLNKNATGSDPNVMYDAYDHTESADQPGCYKIVRRWRKFLDKYAYENNRDYIVLVTEAYNPDVKKVMQHFGVSREERGSDLAINFLMTYYLDKDEKEKHGLELDKQLSNWQSNLPEYAWSDWCLGSHDSRRVTSCLPEKELIDGFYMLLLLQAGTALVYYGDEIGMCDRPFTLANRDEIVDITAFFYGDEHVEEKVRDRQRTPMQWSGQAPNAGFTSATAKPFLPLSDTWPELNVEQQQNALCSHLKLFQQLTKLRQQSPFYGGYQKKVVATKELYAFVRWLNTNFYLIVINVNKKGHDPVISDFANLLKCQNKDLLGEVVARSCNILDDSPIGKERNKVNLNSLVLKSSEAVVFKLFTGSHDTSFFSTVNFQFEQ